MVTLSEDSSEVAIYRAGYVATQLKERFGDCCNGLMIGDSGADNPRFRMFKSYQEEVLQSHQQI